jgi:anion transporter
MCLGPAIGVLIWCLPLGLDPRAHKALAIVGFMLVYWLTETLDHGLTALLGCLLFWLLKVVPSTVAFSGFATPTPWFILSSFFLGQAAAQTGLARRLGFSMLSLTGNSYPCLLFGFTALIFVLNMVLIPPALIAMLAPLALGIVAAWGVTSHSNLAKGLFLILSYVSTIGSKMFLASGPVILATGLLEKQVGAHVLWSQWSLAFLPLILPSILFAWLTIRWLYPLDPTARPPDAATLHERIGVPRAWSRDEWKALGYLLLALTLWSTDALHHLPPAAVGIGVGVLLTLPRLGVLDIKGVRAVSFLPPLFIGGTLSMATVLTETHALTALTAALDWWHEGLLSNAWRATLTLYWGGFLYHMFMASENMLISTLLPVLLQVAMLQEYNPVAMTMLWVFAGGGKLFVYQNTGLVVGHSYGVFTSKDVLKVGAVLSLVEGLFILLLVSLYWPLIGLPWRL